MTTDMDRSVLQEMHGLMDEVQAVSDNHSEINLFAVAGVDGLHEFFHNMDAAELAHLLYDVFKSDSEILQAAVNAISRLSRV